MAFNWEPSAKPRVPQVPRCKGCGGTNIEDDPTSGDRACQNCGVVQQENGIVSTVQFSESGGSSNVVGQFVSGDKGRPSGGGAGRGRGRFGHSRDSRETTIQNGKKKIIQVCTYGRINVPVHHRRLLHRCGGMYIRVFLSLSLSLASTMPGGGGARAHTACLWLGGVCGGVWRRERGSKLKKPHQTHV